MIRRLLDQIEAIDPVDAREAASVREIADGLRSLAHPLDEHADTTHLTGSALIVGSRGMVLLKHRRLAIWLQPGGHIDPGEAPADAALREAVEETGLDVHHPAGGPLLLHVDAHDGGRGHRHLDLRYVLLGPPDEPTPPPGESPDCHWFDWTAAAGLADPGLAGVLPRLEAIAPHVMSAASG